MKYVQINIVPYGSTGSVMMREHAKRLAAGDESWVMWGRGRAAHDDCEFNFGSKLGVCVDAARTRLDGRAGFHSKHATRRLLRKLDKIDPDVVHLHNLHGYYVNVEMLFEWLVARNQQTVWTLHDCWAFTGHCVHFTRVGCYDWITRCDYAFSCPQLKEYPATFAGRSYRKNFKAKSDLFTQLPADKLTLVAPSQWLAGLAGQSFLSKYPVEVRYNTIDRSVFKPTPSDFRERYGLKGKTIVLGVASQWTERKGIGDFVRLAAELDGRFAVVVVGLDRKQLKSVPSQVAAAVNVRAGSVAEADTGDVGDSAVFLGLPATESIGELVEAYSAADVFFNPTQEDNYPTVLLEAQACGTPVVTYRVGGCAEAIEEGKGVSVLSFEEALDYIRDPLKLKPDADSAERGAPPARRGSLRRGYDRLIKGAGIEE